MAGNKHQVNVKWNGTASTMKPFLHGKDSDYQKNMPLNIQPRPATDVATSSGKAVSQFFSRNDVLKSEVLWTLKTISSLCSYNPNQNIDKTSLCFSISRTL